jgi:hypothetical protein
MSGIASALAGVLLIAGFGLHPTGEDPTFGIDPLWVPAHGLLWVAFTIALLGWIGLYIVQASRAGRLGTAAFVVIILGTSIASWIFSSDVTYVPVIAAQSPGLFAQILNPSHILIGVLSVLTWILGNVLFGFSIIRSSVFPKWAGVLLVIGSLVIPVAYLIGLPEKVVAIGGLLVGVSQIWLGSDVFRILRKSTISA